MRWYVYIDERVYGPYGREQLTAFLKPETLVAREGRQDWAAAATDPDLADVLAGAIQPAREWHIARPNKPLQGPYTLQAVVAMIERREIHPRDMIMHQNWSAAMPIGQTRFYAKWRDPTVSLDGFSPEEIRNAPRPKQAAVVAPPSRASRLRDALPRGGPIIIAAAILILFLYAWHVFSRAGLLPGILLSRPAASLSATASDTAADQPPPSARSGVPRR
jgi:hypothetical protein